MKKLTESRGFELAGLALVVIAIFWWILSPQATAWPLVIALIPWVLRLASGKLPFPRTSFDLPIGLFLLTAGIGIWAAYNQDLALRKFFLILGAILLFYQFTNKPEHDRGYLIAGLGIFGLAATALYLLNHDWVEFPADVALLNSLGQWWMQIRPVVNFDKLTVINTVSANIAGGINAFLLPLCISAWLYFRQQKQKFFAVLVFLVAGFLFFGLALSSSRAAWVAAVIGMTIFAILNLSKARNYVLAVRKFLIVLPLLILALGIVVPALLSFIVNAPSNPYAQVPSFTSRIEIARNTLYLVEDYAFTGGGLGSFSGLYSQYMLGIPFFIFSYSHNLFLDVALEQGIVGLIVFAWIIFLCSKKAMNFFTPKDPVERRSMIGASAIYSSLIILLFHGIADDPLYSNFWGLPLLFTLPGLSDASPNISQDSAPKKNVRPVLGLAAILVFAILFHRPILASWYANIGAVLMSRAELKNWPINEWGYWEDTQVFNAAREQFSKAISIDSNQRTANHRLGLIETAGRDFQSAGQFLETAIKNAPGHRGIKKSLGLCYIWLGEFEKADFYLAQIAEAQEEIQIYSWWWQTKNEDSLATMATAYLNSLSSSDVKP